jgi:hypothetical protein
MVLSFLLMIVLIPTACLFTLLALVVVTYHRRKMEVLRQHGRDKEQAGIYAEVEALRAEIRELRDTTTQYDLSFDTSLQRIERRMQQLEQQHQRTRI